jgi:hypothetical protein
MLLHCAGLGCCVSTTATDNLQSCRALIAAQKEAAPRPGEVVLQAFQQHAWLLQSSAGVSTVQER